MVFRWSCPTCSLESVLSYFVMYLNVSLLYRHCIFMIVNLNTYKHICRYIIHIISPSWANSTYFSSWRYAWLADVLFSNVSFQNDFPPFTQFPAFILYSTNITLQLNPILAQLTAFCIKKFGNRNLFQPVTCNVTTVCCQTRVPTQPAIGLWRRKVQH